MGESKIRQEGNKKKQNNNKHRIKTPADEKPGAVSISQALSLRIPEC